MRLLHLLVLARLALCLAPRNHRTYRENPPLVIPRGGTHTLSGRGPQIEPAAQWKTASVSTYRARLKMMLTKKYLWLSRKFLKYYFHLKTRQFVNRVRRLFNTFKESPQSSNYPLVGNTWVVELAKPLNLPQFPGLRQELEFFDDGRVVSASGQEGTWWIELGDLMWKFPLDKTGERYVYFTAKFYVNKLENRPYMRTGVVYRDRDRESLLPRRLFRPVLTKFTGYCV